MICHGTCLGTQQVHLPEWHCLQHWLALSCSRRLFAISRLPLLLGYLATSRLLLFSCLSAMPFLICTLLLML